MDEEDKILMDATFGKHSGETGYNGEADFNEDGVVDEKDYMIFLTYWGRGCDESLDERDLTSATRRRPIIQAFHVSFEGHPSIAQCNKLLVQLCVEGQTYSVRTHDDGKFQVELPLAPGHYTYSIKQEYYLANGGIFTIPSNNNGTIELGMLVAGDFDNDNMVTQHDLMMFQTAFGSQCGGSNYKAAFDLDCNCVVDIHDYTLLIRNVGKVGAPLCPPPPIPR